MTKASRSNPSFPEVQDADRGTSLGSVVEGVFIHLSGTLISRSLKPQRDETNSIISTDFVEAYLPIFTKA